MNRASTPKRILVVLEGGDAYPSGFVRGLIYRPLFEREGYEVRFVNRLPPRLVRLFRSRSSTARGSGSRLLGAWGRLAERRIAALARAHDVVYMSKVFSHRLIAAMKRPGLRIVFDVGDAMWLPGWAERFEDVVRMADAVVTDNEVSALHIRSFNGRVTVVPDCSQVEDFDRRRPAVAKRAGEVRIGWIGSPGTVFNLFAVWEALEQVFPRHANLHLRLLGVGCHPGLRLPAFERVRFSSVSEYTQSQMIDEALMMDIGIFPLQDVDACRVRGILKATVYMAGEAAVIASPVGQLAEFIRDGVNGYLARSTDAWVEHMDRLIVNPALRREVARRGLDLVRRDFTVESSFRKLIDVLDPQEAGSAHR